MAYVQEKKGDVSDVDQSRGIQNASRNVGYSNDVPETVERKTTGRRFEDTEGISARAHKNDAPRDGSSTTGRRERRGEGEQKAEGTRTRMRRNVATRASNIRARMQNSRDDAIALASTSVQVVNSFRNWTIIGILSTVSFWMFMFALFSLVGFALYGVVNDSLVGKILNAFIDLDTYFPALYLGLGLWGLCLIISVCTFVALLLWYYFQKARMMDSPVSFLIMAFCFGASILPVSNLFPWLLLWAIYVNVRTTAGALSSA